MDRTRLIAWMLAGLLPVAAFTAPGVPWQWGFVLTYVAVSFVLQTVVRLKNAEVERFAHIFVLSGSAPIAVRFYFGMNLAPLAVVHVTTVLVISIGVGYLLALQVRPQVKRPNAV